VSPLLFSDKCVVSVDQAVNLNGCAQYRCQHKRTDAEGDKNEAMAFRHPSLQWNTLDVARRAGRGGSVHTCVT
jgi:hypothetical protein